MKQETENAINRVLEVLGKTDSQLTAFCTDIRVVRDLLRKLPEMEQALASGGYVKDDKGNWLKDGDKVKYKDDLLDNEFHFGTVNFDQQNLCWFLTTDVGYFLHLAKDYGEITYIEKA